MSNMNEKNAHGATICIVGNATRPAESKFEGKETHLSVAVARRYQQNGEWKSAPTVYYTVIASGQYAEPLKLVGTGDTVRVDDANYEPRTYTKKDGTTGVSHDLRFGTLTIVKKKEADATQAAAPAQPATDAPW